MRALSTMMQVLAIVVLLAPLAGRAANLDDALSDLSPAAQEKLRVSVQGFLKLEVNPNRSSNDLGWDCLAAISLVNHGVDGAKERLSKIASALMSDTVRGSKSGKIIGWTAASSEMSSCEITSASTHSGKPNCEGAKTTFAFQTGLGIACLSRASEILKRTEYVEAAWDAITYWRRLVQPTTPCDQCVYFATSDSAKHDQRYIRNMNLFMSYGAAELGRVTGAKEITDLAKMAVRSEVWERDNGNKGYLSRLDPLWHVKTSEADRIENHSAAVALLLNELGIALKNPAASSKAEVVYRDWANCDNKRCQTAGCKYWAGNPSTCQATSTATHCAFRNAEGPARSRCETFLQLVPRVNSHGLWAVLQARRS